MALILRAPRADEVTFTVANWVDAEPVKGNASASGDDSYDQEVEASILTELDSGNTWAWCTVRVTAHYKDFEGAAFLGCCSYESEEDFKKSGGYYEDMKKAALEDLHRTLQQAFVVLRPFIAEEGSTE